MQVHPRVYSPKQNAWLVEYLDSCRRKERCAVPPRQLIRAIAMVVSKGRGFRMVAGNRAVEHLLEQAIRGIRYAARRSGGVLNTRHYSWVKRNAFARAS